MPDGIVESASMGAEPKVIAQSTETSGEEQVVESVNVPIPKVDNRPLREKLAHKARLIGTDKPAFPVAPQAAQPDGADDDDEPEEIDLPPERAEAVPATDESTGKKKAAKADDEPEKEIVKPWARARVLEREKREKETEINDLQYRVSALTGAVEKLVNAGVVAKDTNAQPEDQPVDPAIDPVGALMQEQKAIKAMLSELTASRSNERALNAVGQAAQIANKALAEQWETDPVFQGAVGHIAKVVERTTEKRYPNASREDRARHVGLQMEQIKAGWVAERKDPVTEMYDMAMTLGFDPESYEKALQPQAGKKKADPQVDRSTPKERITRAREKATSVATLGGSEGAAPKRVSASDLAVADTGEFNRRLNQMIDQGLVRTRQTPGKSPRFADMLPGKGKQV